MNATPNRATRWIRVGAYLARLVESDTCRWVEIREVGE